MILVNYSLYVDVRDRPRNKMGCHRKNLAVGSLSAQLFQYGVELFQVPIFDFQGATLAAVVDAYL